MPHLIVSMHRVMGVFIENESQFRCLEDIIYRFVPCSLPSWSVFSSTKGGQIMSETFPIST